MYSKTFCASAGLRPHFVQARAMRAGKDISVLVSGGTAPHIGAVSLAVYEPERDSATVSTFTVHTHRDDAVASFFAKAISREMKCTVTVSAGLHVDDANAEDIAVFQKNSHDCCMELIAMLKAAEEK